MKITNEDRVELLKAYNDLRNTLQTIHDCQDIWMSDVGKMERLLFLLRNTFKFTPAKDDKGNASWYEDWVLDTVGKDKNDNA